MNECLFSLVVIAVTGFAPWHRSTVGWIVTAIANAAAAKEAGILREPKS